MNIFKHYADFYDDYYASKNYKGEAEFVLSLVKRYAKKMPKTILEIGCGTGGHLIPFTKVGLKVTGFDLSNAMVKQARIKIERLKNKNSKTIANEPKVKIGDACSYRDGKKYDSVVSMFAVMGYLTSNDDFLAGLRTARAHLRRNGLFIFDVWYGPAVLAEKPETRIQRFDKNGLKTIRLVSPELDDINQIVKVHYNILQINEGKVIAEVEETHEVRFFFVQELELFLANTGFEIVRVCPFMNSDREPELSDWNISVVAKAV